MTAFLQRVRDRRPPGAEAVKDFQSLYRWSVARPDAFWPEVWDFCGVVADPWNEVVVGLERMAPPDPALGPRILFCADGYRYAGKAIDSLARVREVCERIPAIERVVVVPYLSEKPDLSGIRGAVVWGEWGEWVEGGRAVGRSGGLREAEATARPAAG